MTSKKIGLKALAILEATKGILVILVCFGLHKLAGQNIQHVIEVVVGHLHLNPASHLIRELLGDSGKLSTGNLNLLITGGLLYASVRLIEALGLWMAWVWIEWFALLSTGLYLPLETYELITKKNALSAAILVLNLVIVGYLYVVIKGKGRRKVLSGNRKQ